jgi:cyclic beta-1,2-glucan synthetase
MLEKTREVKFWTQRIYESQEPIRSELFSAERLEQHAESLAAAQPVTEMPEKGRELAPRVRDNKRVLLESYHAVAKTVRNQRTITPAAKWLLDNFHVIEEQIADINEHLPDRFYRELPKLAEGPLQGFPRVYGIAWAYVAHMDSRFNPELLDRFVRAYQRVEPLTIGELWALPITLRIVMVENLRRLSIRIVRAQLGREQADRFADELTAHRSQFGREQADERAGESQTPASKPSQAIASAIPQLPEETLRRAFIVQLVQRLRYHYPRYSPSLDVLSQWLAEQGTTLDEIVQAEHSRQAAADLTVHNIITSMRAISAFDWRTFFEDVSLVDQSLRGYGRYMELDFLTRDRYRQAIEELAKRSRFTELDIARAVMAKIDRSSKARRPPDSRFDDRLNDPGYYLIAGGRRAFEAEVGFTPTIRQRIKRAYVARATVSYLASIALITFGLVAALLWASEGAGLAPYQLLLLGLFVSIPASDVAVSLVNRLITLYMSPRHLPRLKLEKGIPTHLRTFVVIPTFLIREAAIREEVRHLENHYLANRDGDLYFGLLSDWPDADTEILPTDDRLLGIAQAAVAELNARHGEAPGGGPRFFLFHRKRLWNEGEQKWMGWERKRGKLHEFNRLLRGAADTTFLPLDGKPSSAPSGVRYIVTLDADTKLPIDAVHRLVGTAAHPLNRPRFDAKRQAVVAGYGILQPRITPTLPKKADRSVFQRIFTGAGGIDTYAAAVSDVYQDLWGEGTYTGKGLYDIDAFESSLAGRIPENSLLSHDLFEGIFARCALVSDIEFFEDFPSHSEVAADRVHRWTRGDWQLLPWLFKRAGRNMPAIDRWKIVDNLRRSLYAPAALATLLTVWSIPGAPQNLWLGFIVFTLAWPGLLPIVGRLVPRRRKVDLLSHWRSLGEDLLLAVGQTLVQIILLAQQAWLMIDAITRTLYRLFVSRRKLLEWVTAAQAKAAASFKLKNFLWTLRGATIIVCVAAVVIFSFNPAAIRIALPLILLWWLAPFVARILSLPQAPDRAEQLAPEEALRARLIARRIWRFFTTFVTAEDRYLPPDNFQEEPHAVLAHRSSPTNFGLYLLSVVSARDFGWLGLVDTIDRLDATLATLKAMERYHGHFFNWYDTQDLRPLEPRYVSTVDSGNLAAHLITLAQACQEAKARPVLQTAALQGVRDTLLSLEAAMTEIEDNRRTQTVTVSELSAAINGLKTTLWAAPETSAEWSTHWKTLAGRADTLLDIASTFAAERDEADSEVLAWAELLIADIQSQRRDIDILLPWASLGVPAFERLATTQEAVHWKVLKAQLEHTAALDETPQRCRIALEHVHALKSLAAGQSGRLRLESYFTSLEQALESSSAQCIALIERLNRVTALSRQLFQDMNFRFLFDDSRKWFAIGYRVTDACLDQSYYDLLASEARLTSYLAVAKRDVPTLHWFRLGRRLVPTASGPALVSWSGSMFEYLMPSLVMYTPRGSLLDLTCRRIVRQQIEYGEKRGVPWGVSESAMNVRDLHLTYQYSDFGVPGLGLKRGLGVNLVIAPYATALAAMYDVHHADENFRRLGALGALRRYGFYEAVDFTSGRVPETQQFALVRAYMAHHQGMSLVALANVVFDGLMRHRFHREPIIQSAELLLQERFPREAPVVPPPEDQVPVEYVKEVVPVVSRRFDSPLTPYPVVHLLSNGRYAVMMTNAGSGYSVWDKFAITRWREDVTRDAYGSFLYLRDQQSGQVWSAGYQPRIVMPDGYEANFAEDRARITRRDGSLTTTLEVVVSPEDNAEIRRLTLNNCGDTVREIEITSYAEVVLAPLAADIAHPAFSNLFVQTEYAAEVRSLIASRRPRSAHDPQVWAAHVLALPGNAGQGIEYETDRARFLGRGHTVSAPLSVMDGRPLSNTVGPVLDPIFSLRCRLRVKPEETVHVAFATVAASTREAVIDLADKYHDLDAFERISALAWTQTQVQLHHLRIQADEAQLFQYLASYVLYCQPGLRPSGDLLKLNTLSVTGLWRHRISGDRPIVLLRVSRPEDRDITWQLLRAHEYWRLKRVAADLVILNEKATSYAQELQVTLESMAVASQSMRSHEAQEEHGGIFVVRADLLSPEEKILLQAAARVVLVGSRGNLAEQVLLQRARSLPPLSPRRLLPLFASYSEIDLPLPRLDFFNGLGGFAHDGREYVIALKQGQNTPAPWVNVIANPNFGFVVSEAGSSCTWCLNSRENQLTPWSNDPVSDTPGEAIYIRDDETGALWTPTALPIRIENASYIAHHGQGYSVFEHASHGIISQLQQFVSWEEAIKISRLQLENTSDRVRKLSVAAYVEWVLGPSRSKSIGYAVTEHDAETGALFAYNPWNTDFGQRIAFVDLSGQQTSWTCDRTEFLGRNSGLSRPQALLRGGRLSNQSGAGLDACSALLTAVELKPGQRVEVVVLLGQADDRQSARELVRRYRQMDMQAALTAVTRNWERLLGKVQVETPDRSMDILLNRWLLYQTLSCRFWARAAFYQAGGAYGFRDQLQDSMALALIEPELARSHLLRAAARQFLEGDVQHWWHPPTGRGVRTHFSDDRIWLPFVAYHYIAVTGDRAVLDEIVPFIQGSPLPLEQEDAHYEPMRSDQCASLYEHCKRALDVSLGVGAHGLPLMGTGDWNDGMNRVGHEGKGESVWLAWFLYTALVQFAELAKARGDRETATRWLDHAARVLTAIETEAWDGAWYRRAYFDDGTPLGSAANAECRIDSIAQSWSVISGAGDPERARRAMSSVEQYLIRHGDDLVLLFTPPFDKTHLDPGYIKGYLPGVRENGGQYTHAAIWSLMAFALLGDGDQAGELFKMLNPINRAATRAGVYAYKVEPYVVAADIYAEPPHVRRGGWTWYTGSSGWFYRAGVEFMLGLSVRAGRLYLDPCIPTRWRSYNLYYRHENARYRIHVENPNGVARGLVRLELDGVLQEGNSFLLVADGKTHRVNAVLG